MISKEQEAICSFTNVKLFTAEHRQRVLYNGTLDKLMAATGLKIGRLCYHGVATASL